MDYESLSPEQKAYVDAMAANDPSIVRNVGQFAGNMASNVPSWAINNVIYPAAKWLGSSAVDLTRGVSEGISGHPVVNEQILKKAENLYNPNIRDSNSPIVSGDLQGPPPPTVNSNNLVKSDLGPITNQSQQWFDPRLQSAVSRFSNAANEQAKAIGDAGKEISSAISDQQKSTGDRTQQYLNEINYIQDKRMQASLEYENAMRAAVEARQKIPTSRPSIFQDKNTEQKVLASLAIGVGALLTPITGATNVVYDRYQNAITNDIRNQVEKYNKAHDVAELKGNLYAHFRQNGLDTESSFNATKAIMNYQLSQKVDEIGNRMEDPKQKASAKALSAKFAGEMIAADNHARAQHENIQMDMIKAAISGNELKPLSPEAAGKFSLIHEGLSQIDAIDKKYDLSSIDWDKLGSSPKNQIRTQMGASLGYILSGANIPKNEWKTFEAIMVPVAKDSRDEASRKIVRFKKFAANYMTSIDPTGQHRKNLSNASNAVLKNTDAVLSGRPLTKADEAFNPY